MPITGWPSDSSTHPSNSLPVPGKSTGKTNNGPTECVLASYERSCFHSFLTKLGFIPGCHPGSWLGPTNMGKYPSGILAGTSLLWRERPRRAVMRQGAMGFVCLAIYSPNAGIFSPAAPPNQRNGPSDRASGSKNIQRIQAEGRSSSLARSGATPGSSGLANHRASYSHRCNAAHRSHARRSSRMSDDDTRPLLVHRNDNENHGAQSPSRAQVNRSILRSKPQTIWLSF